MALVIKTGTYQLWVKREGGPLQNDNRWDLVADGNNLELLVDEYEKGNAAYSDQEKMITKTVTWQKIIKDITE